MDDLASHYLDTARRIFESQKRLGEGAFTQLDERELHWTPDPESNSIAVIVKHLHGNMRSRWTDFLHSDGEKPDRDRDGEFEPDPMPDPKALWDEGWQHVFGALSRLTPADLLRTVTIRGEPHTVVGAIERQSAHYANHVGQIVYIAKVVRGSEWRTLSIPRNRRRGPR